VTAGSVLRGSQIFSTRDTARLGTSVQTTAAWPQRELAGYYLVDAAAFIANC
jgi:hypothetical protein